jgi:uncharacterized protein
MKINVSQLLKESSGSRRAFMLDDRISLVELPKTMRVSGDIELVRTDCGIWASGTMESTVPLSCSRCTAEFQKPIEFLVEEEFLPRIDILSGANIDQSDHDLSATIDSQHGLDFTDIVRQYAAMALPMKPVCREECAGMCANCGGNLNETSCKCQPDTTDNHWGPLREILAPLHENR